MSIDAHARRIGTTEQRCAIDRAAVIIAAAFPELAVTTEEDAVVLSGRELAGLSLGDARLRAIGSMLA